MKKHFYSFLAMLTAMFALSSCEDVPMPYDLPIFGGGSSDGFTLPYSSASCQLDWTKLAVNGKGDPWSQGSSYTQATGYQKWEGDTKTNKETEGLLISPKINTTTDEGKVKIAFDYCIGYANNDANFAEHVKIYATTGYAENDADLSKWTLLNWKPTHTSTDWTLKTEEVQLPDDFVNKEDVTILFYFYSPAEKSCTFEIKNFVLSEGEAQAGETPTPGPSGESSEESPYTVAVAKSASGNQYVKGYIVGYVDGTKFEDAKFGVPAQAETEILIAESASETDASKTMPIQLPYGNIRDGLELYAHPDYLGKEVLLYGSIETYFGTTGMKSTSWAKINGQEIGKKPGSVDPDGEAKGSGTLEDPFNASAANAYAKNGGDATKDVYVKGKICNIKSIDVSKYERAQYYISDDGTTNSEQFYIYNGYYLGGEKFTSNDQIKIGDEVIVCGKIVTFGSIYEMDANSKIVSINGKTTTEPGSGGNDNPGGNTGGGQIDPSTGYVMTSADILSALPNITTNAYGSQLAADESTWMSWSYNNYGWKGARICKATDTNLGVQVQGNASDAAKQGFIFNTTAFSNISKVVLVVSTTASSQYEPDFSLYAGTSAHPITTKIQGAKSVEAGSSYKVFTYTYDLSSSNYGFITIWNNLVGALYINTIQVITK